MGLDQKYGNELFGVNRFAKIVNMLISIHVTSCLSESSLPIINKMLDHEQETKSSEDSNEDNLLHYIGINDVHNNQLNTPMDRITRFYHRLAPSAEGEMWEIRPKSGSRLIDSPNRLDSMGGLISQFDNQRANLVSLLGHRGLNNWKREGAETYKNMFLGVRG
uniref:Uncharacterized protein n=1 Tax=Tetranychus urticae TaxID=32264 RepID=T1K7S5_TETUR